MPNHRTISYLLGFAFTLTGGSQLPAAEPVKPLKALLVIGGCCHEYGVQKDILAKGIAERAHVEVTIAYEADTTTKVMNPIYASSSWAEGYDVIIHDECTSQVDDLTVIDRILAPHRQGKPGVVLHCGMHCYRSQGYPDAVTPWFAFTGLQSTGHGPQAPIDVMFIDQENPITQGMTNWITINEELYNNSAGKLLDTAKALARGKQTAKNKQKVEVTSESTVVWTNLYGDKTRVFATTLGHNTKTVADPRYLDLVARGLLWSCDKLNDDYRKTQ